MTQNDDRDPNETLDAVGARIYGAGTPRRVERERDELMERAARMYGGSAAAVYDTYVDAGVADPHRPGPPDDGTSLDDIGRRMYRR